MELPEAGRITAGDREAYLTEDILSMVSTSFVGDHWRTLPDSLIIDLGWYAPSEGDGFYRLCVLRGSWDNVVIVVENPDQYVIRDCIDYILEALSTGASLEQISPVLKTLGKQQ
ncbi:hypothetical protein ACFPH6_22145 [Streptomyces xiangluensis]|uniref:Uncharacterized protein n=1 Tax=Streptomyces xiangluensis TaxID=2665720 RepID=A0ABV8YRK8_9ACTN